MALLEGAARMLAEARSLDDLRGIRDLALAAKTYARARGLGVDAENHATAIRLRVERRIGGMLKESKAAGERLAGRPQKESDLATLSGLGVTRHQSSAWQPLAAMPDEAFEAAIAPRKAEPLSARTVYRKARYASAKAVRAAKPKPTLPATCALRLGDFRDVLADVPDGSVDIILTDPPYPAEYLPLWSDLATFAKRVLKPSGMLAAMSGQTHLPEVMALLGEHLPYRWVMAYLTEGAANVVHARGVSTMWKPVLIYGHSGRRIHDVARSDAADKAHHVWGQSESGMMSILRLLADPGQVVCDPFAGAGTTAVVALAHGCSFLGAEVDPDTFAIASERLAT